MEQLKQRYLLTAARVKTFIDFVSAGGDHTNAGADAELFTSLAGNVDLAKISQLNYAQWFLTKFGTGAWPLNSMIAPEVFVATEFDNLHQIPAKDKETVVSLVTALLPDGYEEQNSDQDQEPVNLTKIRKNTVPKYSRFFPSYTR